MISLNNANVSFQGLGTRVSHRNIGAEARAMMGITDGMVRLSVGLEDTDDLIGDLKQAMAA